MSISSVNDTIPRKYGFSEYVKQANENVYDGNGTLISFANNNYRSISKNALFTRFGAFSAAISPLKQPKKRENNFLNFTVHHVFHTIHHENHTVR